MADIDWSDGAQLAPFLHDADVTAATMYTSPTPVVLTITPLGQVDKALGLYPMPYVVSGLLTSINAEIGTLTAPPVQTLGLELDYNSDPLLFGYPVDAVWVVTLHCTPKPLQYWG